MASSFEYVGGAIQFFSGIARFFFDLVHGIWAPPTLMGKRRHL